jgi:butyryl-CoA dehydrogenase/short/branched chain acyl-CoA dehydrogenase
VPVDKGDHFELTGQKLWITNGNEAEIFVLFATMDPAAGYKGITAFIVEKQFAGFSVGKKEDKLGIPRFVDYGIDSSITARFRKRTCSVKSARVTKSRSKLERRPHRDRRTDARDRAGRIRSGAQVHAGTRTVRSDDRKFSGRAISARGDGGRYRGDASSRLQRRALERCGQAFLKEAAMAKLYSSRCAERVSSKAIELYGGYGYVKDYPVEKFWRDSKIGSIYEGTSNMQLQTIAKLIMK